MGSRVLEEIAEEYLKDLNDKNLIIVVKRHKSGTIKSFSIHDLLRDMCIKVGEQTDFFRVIEEWRGRTKGTDRRIFFYASECRVANVVARSIMTIRFCNVNFDECKLLRVWETVKGDDKSMSKVCGNVNLRYLVLETESRRYGKLLSSARLFWNLQTLIIIDFSHDSIVASPDIWKMRQLRHFKCTDVYLSDPGNQQDCMENLQTLEGAVNLRLSEEVCRIIPNIKKLYLIYNLNLRGHDSGWVECLRNLDRLHKLESLSMKVTHKSDRELGSKLAFPLSLKKLCLSSWTLCWEDLLVIGSLPQLQVLHLKFIDSYSKAEHRWSPSGDQFLGLKYLKLYYCQLTSWDADNSHFPILEKLVLFRVEFLEEIPLEIGEIPTLELIRVECCEESVAISALKIKKDKLENEGSDALQIEIMLRSEEDAERFKKRMEAEELDLDLLNKLVIW